MKFSTYQDNQSVVLIQVFEGEYPLTKDNHLIGKFELTGISPHFHVTFEVHHDGILRVRAKEKGTGNEKSINITAIEDRLFDFEIEYYIIEHEEISCEQDIIDNELWHSRAYRYAAEAFSNFFRACQTLACIALIWTVWRYYSASRHIINREMAERVNARNGLERYAYHLKNMLDDDENGVKGKIRDDDAKTINEAVHEMLHWLDENPQATKDEINEQKKELEGIANPFIKIP